MQVRQLVPTPRIDHVRPFLHLVLLLVYHEALIGEHRADIVLLLLPTDDEDLVLGLDRGEVRGQQVGVAERDLDRGLRVQLVNEERLLLVGVVVEARLDGGKDVVGLEGDHVVEETAEFVGFGFDFDRGSGVAMDVLYVRADLVFEVLHILLQLRNDVLLLEDLQVLFALIEFYHILDSLIDAVLETLQFV